MVNGKGKDITDADFVQAASVVGVPGNFVIEAIRKTEKALARFDAALLRRKA